MKNHKIVNGRLLQTNKKWSHLKRSQRTWIADITKKAHEKYILKHNKLPIKKKKYEIPYVRQDEIDRNIEWWEIQMQKNGINPKRRAA